MKKLLSLFCVISCTVANGLPTNFVFLKDIDPSIIQNLRYKTDHNFIGRPIDGYSQKTECVLTRPAALALHNIQTILRKKHLSLMVFDCYRPQRAVNEFITWSKITDPQLMKTEFYPRVNKEDFFTLGYVAAKSGHSRGSTMDLTIVPLPTPTTAIYHRGEKLTACFAPYQQRFFDGGIDMGTGFDCMDQTAHPDDHTVSPTAQRNRLLLQKIMIQHGFTPLATEWWHFTLKNEPYPNTYFDFLANRS